MVYENESMIIKTILQLVIKVYTNLSWLRTGKWRKTVNSKIYIYRKLQIYIYFMDCSKIRFLRLKHLVMYSR